MRVTRRSALGLAAATPLLAASTANAAAKHPRLLAPTPPMGWNSWNSFATTINEAQARETARIMAERLLPFGYDVFTIDIQWYEPEAKSYTYNSDPQPAMDAYGRLIPAPNRFPSSVGGKGFAPLAADVHELGLKFGVHLMRGIPRMAVKRNLPILGTSHRAQDIADTASICPWNPDMYGVDMRKAGAQAYYDSVFRLFASWGVDFVKMDDMSRPYDSHASEIEAAQKAIVASGRPMILSLSPGETPVPRADHVRHHAQMWRISDDFWDEWPLLEAQFTRLENWNSHRRPGGWPDADMLPLGRLALGERDTRFTPAEQRTVMTLWSIARSPLIMGGDLRHLDAPTMALLTNPEVLAVNQASSGNMPYFVEDGMRVWTAQPASGGDRYLALFNTTAKEREVGIDFRWLGISSQVRVRDLWERSDIGTANGRFAAILPSHGAGLYRLS
jgi:alpha-galactosidase